MLPPDLASALQRAAPRAKALRLDLRWFASLTSTMDIAEEAARAGSAEGLAVITDHQTAGRGRRGRAWSSPPGAGLYLSLLLRPPAPGEPHAFALSLLTLAAGVAVREAIAQATGLHAALKWPNDLLVGSRKLAGILAEAIGLGTDHAVVVLGVGINVMSAAHPEDVAVRATSLQAELNAEVDRGVLLEELLVAVARRYDDLRRENADDILREWRAAAPSANGAVVEWDVHDGVRRGTTQGIDSSGALLVRTPDGVHRIVGGELRWMN